MRWVGGGARCAVSKLPLPVGDRARRAVNKVHRQWRRSVRWAAAEASDGSANRSCCFKAQAILSQDQVTQECAGLARGARRLQLIQLRDDLAACRNIRGTINRRIEIAKACAASLQILNRPTACQRGVDDSSVGA